jgi:hypothetical protein
LAPANGFLAGFGLKRPISARSSGHPFVLITVGLLWYRPLQDK